MKLSLPDDFPTQAHKVVKDLFEPNRTLYWLDFGFHVLLGWSSFVAAVLLPTFSPLQLVALLVAAFAMYRAAIFIHELSHFKRGDFKAFRVVWNLVCGIPLFVPSYWYSGVHIEHHKRNIYGTPMDGEYIPFVVRGRWSIVKYVLMHLWLPVVFAGKPLLLTPVTLISRVARKYSWEKVSALAIDLDYVRPPADPRDAGIFRLQDFATMAYAYLMVALLFTGVLPWKVAIIWYCLAALVFVTNAFRTCVAHAYRNPDDAPMSLSEQFLDSVDIVGHPFFTALWAPVGLRYHATHHLFASMPYHNLGLARRRLEAAFGPDSAYTQAKLPNFRTAFMRLWREAGKPAPSALPTGAEGAHS